MTRSLVLRRESLAPLTVAELGGVAGGQDLSILSCPLLRCVPTRNCDQTDPTVVTDAPTMPRNCYTVPWC